MSRPDVRSVTVFVYGLAGPDGVVRYVGRSARPWQRFSDHLNSNAKPEIKAWVRELAAAGQEPQLLVLHIVYPGEDAAPAELIHIQLHESTGRLFNCVGTKSHRRCRYCRSDAHDGATCRMKYEHRAAVRAQAGA